MDNDGFQQVFFGEVVDAPVLTPELAERHLSERGLRERCDLAREVPLDAVVDTLHRVGQRLTEAGSPYRAAALERLPGLLGYSVEMVAEGLGFLAAMVEPEALRARLAILGDPRCLDHWVGLRHGRLRRAVPVGAVCHVAAGNVFLGSVDSLLYGMLTKNVNLLKASRQDLVFPSLFFRALLEVDREGCVAPFAALTYWGRHDGFADEVAKSRFEAILLFGGEDSVRAYKQGLAPRTEVYAYGPKLSFGVVPRGLAPGELRAAAEGFAADVVHWEQRACSCCQNVFVEEDPTTAAFPELLFAALEARAAAFPQPRPDLDAAVEIRKERELARWREFEGEGRVLEGRAAHHTVLVRRSRDTVDSPLNRTVYVNLVSSWRQLLDGNLRSMKYYLSTVGIAGTSGLQEMVEAFTGLGAPRLCRPGSMAVGGDPRAAHDGQFLCLQLARLVERDDLPADRFGSDFSDPGRRSRLLLARLNDRLRNALRAPFYRQHLRDVALPLASLDDFARLPVLEKDALYEHGPASGADMLTRDPGSAYLFSAGGTTGRMKYVLYSREEFDESKRIFGLGFAAAGVEPTDTVANVLRAGAFWTAFLAANAGLEEVGCRILSVTGNHTPAETLAYLRAFRATAVLGVPSALLLLAQEAERGGGLQLDKVLYSGEHLVPSVEAYLRRVLGARLVRSLGYAAVEVGPVGFQCPHCQGTEHHVFEDWCYLEADADGDALVTTLGKTLHPLIRYRLGDRVEWLDEPCPCGRSSRRFRLCERTDDQVKVNYGNLHLSTLYEVVEPFPELSGFFQVRVEPVGVNLRVRFLVETREPGEPPAGLAERVRAALLEKAPPLRGAGGVNLVEEVTVELLPPEGIGRVERTGKIRRIVDLRR